MRGARPWWLALAGSLLLHGGLLGGLQWELPQWQAAFEPPPIEARLMPPSPVPAARPPAAKPPAAPPRPRPVPPADPRPEPIPEALAPETAADAEEVVAIAEPVEEMPPAEPEPEAAAEPTAEPALPPLNSLPSRLDLRFHLRYGPARGEQTLIWVNEGDRYTITSVAAATGLTSVFYSGRFAQTSRGRITERGLMPEEFWDQRGDKRSSARFDAASGSLTLSPAKGSTRHFSYTGDVQDALSLFFQMALTAPPSGGQLAYAVFNGKKLRHYTYDVRGEEILETALGPLRTLHLARKTGEEGRFEIWLAIDRHYLPVRVLRVEESGAEGEMAIRAIDAGE
ncbi:MAG: hypothetical protein QG662_504 [Pseudomonadota bacterium]|nr:hypothetical protein [Pseudomonadota bacterium]